MNYITTTQLRTETPELITALMYGQNVNLIHRSQVIGEIRPKKTATKTFDADSFIKAVKALNLKPTTQTEREKNYRSHLEKKYGKNIS